MPKFEFKSPDGKTYLVEGPEGATQEQAWDMLQQSQKRTGALESMAKFGAGMALNATPIGRLASTQIPERVSRLLSNVTPEGPISGLIGLMRTAGQAAQGRRPDLLAAPESAIPEAVQGGLVGMSRPRSILGGRAPGEIPEPPRMLTYAPDQAARVQEARAAATRMRQEMQARGEIPEGPPGPSIEMAPGAGQAPVQMRALQPHLNTIMGVMKRNPRAISTLEGALPPEILTEALSSPAKTASIAAWLQVYERVAKAGFTPVAQASLELATRNLNNNLGSELSLRGIVPENIPRFLPRRGPEPDVIPNFLKRRPEGGNPVE